MVPKPVIMEREWWGLKLYRRPSLAAQHAKISSRYDANPCRTAKHLAIPRKGKAQQRKERGEDDETHAPLKYPNRHWKIIATNERLLLDPALQVLEISGAKEQKVLIRRETQSDETAQSTAGCNCVVPRPEDNRHPEDEGLHRDGSLVCGKGDVVVKSVQQFNQDMPARVYHMERTSLQESGPAVRKEHKSKQQPR